MTQEETPSQAARAAAADYLREYNETRRGGLAVDGPNLLVQAFARFEEQTRTATEREVVAKAIPPEIAELVLRIGKAEWGQTFAHDADGHGQHIAESVRKTDEHFGDRGPQHMHGLYAEGTETVICHTGTSPNSPTIAQALTGAWNWLHDQAQDQSTILSELSGGSGV